MKFFNISNHPSSTWTDEQKKAAERVAWDNFQTFEGIIDIPFPAIDPADSGGKIVEKARKFVWEIVAPQLACGTISSGEISSPDGYGTRSAGRDKKYSRFYGMVCGEWTFAFSISTLLISQYDAQIFAATTERVVVENGNEKTSKFIFKQFRQFHSL